MPSGFAAPAYQLPTPPVLSSICRWSSFSGIYVNSQTSGASATTPAANQAIYVPITVTTPVTFRRGFWLNGSAPGSNVCVALYLPDQTRVATTGSVALSGASVIQSAAFSAAYDATPGLYYMAIGWDAADANGVIGFGPSLNYRMAGLFTQAVGAFPLPNPAVFATWASFLLPVFGITTTSFAI